MELSSIKMIPEFQHYFNKFITTSTLNKYGIPVPVDIDEIYFMFKNSFIRLLFDNKWDKMYDTYRYYWMRNDSRISWPAPIKSRLNIYPDAAQFFELTTNSSYGENFFNLKDHDLILLDALLSYRLTEEGDHELVIDESEAGTGYVAFDPATKILYATFNDLNTNLSKLIFIYLKLKVYDTFEDYHDEHLIANKDNVLELAYEAYVINQIFKFVAKKDGIH